MIKVFKTMLDASELESQFQKDAEQLKVGINAILNSGPTACVSVFGGTKDNYIGNNGRDFLYRCLSNFTVKRWKDLAEEFNLSLVMVEENYLEFTQTYFNPKAVKAFAREEIEKALDSAFNEPKDRIKKRLRNFLASVATNEDFSFKNSSFTYKSYFTIDQSPKGYSEVKTFLIDVKNATEIQVDLVAENQELRSLDIIRNPNVNLFNDQIKIKGFKSGKLTIRIAPKIAKNLDSFIGL